MCSAVRTVEWLSSYSTCTRSLGFTTIINVNILDHKYTVPWPGNLMDFCQDLQRS